jgi:Mo-co oxidoreductase dimerisation domain
MDVQHRRARPAQVGAGQGNAAARPLRDHGRRLGAPIAEVEVQIDDGPWTPATLDDRHRGYGSRGRRGFAWRFWTLNWGRPPTGVHTIRSRAFDVDGNVQPAPDDPYLASKVTFWESNGQIARRVQIPPDP